jgi:hypothetical protein
VHGSDFRVTPFECRTRLSRNHSLPLLFAALADRTGPAMSLLHRRQIVSIGSNYYRLSVDAAHSENAITFWYYFSDAAKAHAGEKPSISACLIACQSLHFVPQRRSAILQQD